MTRTTTTTWILALLAVGLSGCRGPEASGPISWPRDAYPTWTYIPLPSLKKPKGFPAEVALPEWRYTTNRIRIVVAGRVKSPGEHSVSETCSVMEAIGYAGGFSPGAYTSRVRVAQAGGAQVRLRLVSRRTWLLGHKQVWYKPEAGQDLTQRTSPRAADTDFVLQDRDVLIVRGVD